MEKIIKRLMLVCASALMLLAFASCEAAAGSDDTTITSEDNFDDYVPEYDELQTVIDGDFAVAEGSDTAEGNVFLEIEKEPDDSTASVRGGRIRYKIRGWAHVLKYRGYKFVVPMRNVSGWWYLDTGEFEISASGTKTYLGVTKTFTVDADGVYKRGSGVTADLDIVVDNGGTYEATVTLTAHEVDETGLVD